ncbi:MAG: thioredoxin [Chitinophagaceae bacterium]|nr:thioredoxin [Chitinophagaceae bacterium]MBN8666992.1 thioredoxin [Chitinophagales bacterium]MDX1954174.1 thioredoxin [Chitinophagaceae bacterium]
METQKKESFNDLIQGDIPVLVDFTAAWCGPCKMMKPILEELHDRMGDAIRIIKVDIDRNQNAAMAFQVQSVPTLILFKNGNQLWRQSGVVQTGPLERTIRAVAHL